MGAKTLGVDERFCTEIVNDGVVQQKECFINTEKAEEWGNTVVSGADVWRIRDKETNRVVKEME
jgi:hypothetical protein